METAWSQEAMEILEAKIVLPLILLLGCCYSTYAIDRAYNFEIDKVQYSVACHSKEIVAVNGISPGPQIRVNTGDRIIVKVTNKAHANITIHWHGIHQMLSAWADGPAYITQCPIRTGQSFTYNFTVPDQEGTLFWHAHIGWLRGTVYGSFIIDPAPHAAKPPYPTPDGEHTLLLGEWWHADLEEIEKHALKTGKGPRGSDAYLINGHTGPRNNCSDASTHIVDVEQNKQYLLRVINNALQTDLFITIAYHSLTVVETDASYTKQISNSSFLIHPGQTYNFLITANQAVGQYYIVVSPFQRSKKGVQEIPALAILRYNGSSSSPIFPSHVPDKHDRTWFENSQKQVKSLNSPVYPASVPKNVDLDLYYVVSINKLPCDKSFGCEGDTSLASSINNVTFQEPHMDLLQAYYNKIDGIYTTDFPSKPPLPYDYSHQKFKDHELTTNKGTKVTEIEYGAEVQLVLQGTLNVQDEAHPFHLHGTDFYVVGYGEGNYNPSTDPARFNLVDPARRNTAMLPAKGWTALRWKAENPGVWLMHCHYEGHVSWGMETVFVVKNGNSAILPPPPADLPKC